MPDEPIAGGGRGGGTSSPSQTRGQILGLVLGPLAFLAVLALDLSPGKPEVTRMAAVAVLMAVFWISDAIPLAATALLPVLLYPLLGIMAGKKVAPEYINSVVFLFLGGFMIALAMEKWNLHRRIAIRIILTVGCGASRIILGFMIAGAFLSMWISNTATAIMMMPIAMSIVLNLEEQMGQKATHDFTVALMLAIAYSCSVGGIATLVGTPPNLSFARIFQITFPDAPPVLFGQWLIMALPYSVLMVGLIWYMLTRLLFRSANEPTVDQSVVDQEYKALGRMSFEEKAVMTIFISTAVLWVFRAPLVIGSVTLPGWSQLLPFPQLIDDGTVAICLALVLFVVPTRSDHADTATVLSPDVFRRLPWHIVLLFGGGFALAMGFKETGLSDWIGQQLAGVSSLSPLAIIITVCVLLTLLTELTSNTATTEMILPVLAATATAAEINPLMLMVPATIAASNAFMMPVATPPNAIIFGSGRVRIAEMARAGIFINLVAMLMLTAVFYLLGVRVFDIDRNVFPAWARG